jgi:hypothetical protein
VGNYGQACQYGEVVVGLLEAHSDVGGKPEVVALRRPIELGLDPAGERVECGQDLVHDRVAGQVGNGPSGLLELVRGGLRSGLDRWLDVADAGQFRNSGQGLVCLVCLQRGIGEGGGVRGREPLTPFRCRVRCGP